MKKIAVIPARSGSKRIPNKNLVDFFGKPLVAHTILASLKSNCFSRVIVSTDSEAYGHIARSYGAEVLIREAGISNDEATIAQVGLHAVSALQMEKDDQLALLFPTCPLRESHVVQNFCSDYDQGQAQAMITVCDYGNLKPHWAIDVEQVQNEKKFQFYFGDQYLTNSQNLRPLYCPSGAIWMQSVENLLKYRTIYNEHLKFFKVSARVGIDIDTPEDLELAGIYMRGTQKE